MSTAVSPSASEARAFRRPIIVMGVAGCGKSSVGMRLAEALSLPYQEGDDLHPQANIAKMSSGTPLDDGDRWLVNIDNTPEKFTDLAIEELASR